LIATQPNSPAANAFCAMPMVLPARASAVVSGAAVADA
jgi:hypothetical protein